MHPAHWIGIGGWSLATAFSLYEKRWKDALVCASFGAFMVLDTLFADTVGWPVKGAVFLVGAGIVASGLARRYRRHKNGTATP